MKNLLVAIISGIILALVFCIVFFACLVMNEILALVVGIAFVVMLIAVAFVCLGYELANAK